MLKDSAALGYLQSQLAHIEPQLWARKYTDIIYQDLFPVSFEAGEHATSIEVYFSDDFTEGKFVGAGGDDYNLTQTETTRDIVPVRLGGIGYEYTLEELRQSQFLNRPLDARKAMNARRGYEEHAQRICFFGDALRGMEGALNNSNIPTAASASTLDAALGGANPGDDSAALINEPLNAIWVDSNGTEIGDTVLVPLDHLAKLATTRLGTVNDTTILSYILANNIYTANTGQPLKIRAIPQLTDSLMAYSSSPDVMIYHIPLALRFLPPQLRGTKFLVPGEYKLSGVEVRYPAGANYRTGF